VSVINRLYESKDSALPRQGAEARGFPACRAVALP